MTHSAYNPSQTPGQINPNLTFDWEILLFNKAFLLSLRLPALLFAAVCACPCARFCFSYQDGNSRVFCESQRMREIHAHAGLLTCSRMERLGASDVTGQQRSVRTLCVLLCVYRLHRLHHVPVVVRAAADVAPVLILLRPAVRDVAVLRWQCRDRSFCSAGHGETPERPGTIPRGRRAVQQRRGHHNCEQREDGSGQNECEIHICGSTCPGASRSCGQTTADVRPKQLAFSTGCRLGCSRPVFPLPQRLRHILWFRPLSLTRACPPHTSGRKVLVGRKVCASVLTLIPSAVIWGAARNSRSRQPCPAAEARSSQTGFTDRPTG